MSIEVDSVLSAPPPWSKNDDMPRVVPSQRVLGQDDLLYWLGNFVKSDVTPSIGDCLDGSLFVKVSSMRCLLFMHEEDVPLTSLWLPNCAGN